ncbi:hypothetical protein chiPu_0026623 [Chiloscyllium punctatum]|uniref:Uncharacterized protein n=1 Tax=Chiloscyllium punctatum TaxID=137246 RepID=A0A401TJ25_CHIPU|nr:hypothetical protein [Chiloscyllium punctatum]
MNRTLKVAIAKAITETGQGWVDVLPCILMHLRATPGRSTGLTPFELMMARAIRLPETATPSSRTYRQSAYSAHWSMTHDQPAYDEQMYAMPDDLTSAPAFDAFAIRDLSICGYYEPTNAAVISLYLCFSPSPQPHHQQPRLPRYYCAPL